MEFAHSTALDQPLFEPAPVEDQNKNNNYYYYYSSGIVTTVEIGYHI